jgi:hypothetical protein
VIGPYFFEEGGAKVSVTVHRYVEMLETFLRPKLDDVDTEHVWFQQDGATAHTERRSLGVLREMFPGRLISLRGDVEWPARSPDLSPCDFFLRGYLKEKGFKHRPGSLEDLKEKIQQEIDSIPPELTRRDMKNFRDVFSNVLPTTAAICLILFLKPIKKLFLCTFQKHIQFFSR